MGKARRRESDQAKPERYRKELESLEAEHHGRSVGEPVFTPFHKRHDAEAFARELATHAAMTVEVIEIPSSAIVGSEVSVYDIEPPPGGQLAVEVAYRARERGVAVGAIRNEPINWRIDRVADALFARALSQRRWSGPPYSRTNIEQCRELAGLEDAHIREAILRARRRFFSRHRRLRLVSSSVGAVLTLGGGVAIYTQGMGILSVIAAGVGVCFIFIALACKTSPSD
jgi:hypothetical protein